MKAPNEAAGRAWPRVLVGAVVLSTALTSCVADLNPSAASRAPSATATQLPPTNVDTGPSFPGKQARDFAANAGDGVTYGGGVWVASTPIQQARRTGDRYICTQVTIRNSTAEAVRFSYIDWKLQFPSGVIHEATSSGAKDNLDGGELASGGTVNGSVCFDEDSKNGALPTGTYVLLLEPELFSKERIAWINEIGGPTATSSATSTATSSATSTATSSTKTTTPASQAGTAPVPTVRTPMLSLETKSGLVWCEVTSVQRQSPSSEPFGSDSADCQGPFEQPEAQGYASVGTSGDGTIKWFMSNMSSANPRLKMQYEQTYTWGNWTIYADSTGTRFTNNATGHGMFVSIQNVYAF